MQEQRAQLSSLKLSCAFYSENVFTLKIIGYNHCCLWIQRYLHTEVLFMQVFILGVEDVLCGCLRCIVLTSLDITVLGRIHQFQ